MEVKIKHGKYSGSIRWVRGHQLISDGEIPTPEEKGSKEYQQFAEMMREVGMLMLEVN